MAHHLDAAVIRYQSSLVATRVDQLIYECPAPFFGRRQRKMEPEPRSLDASIRPLWLEQSVEQTRGPSRNRQSPDRGMGRSGDHFRLALRSSALPAVWTRTLPVPTGSCELFPRWSSGGETLPRLAAPIQRFIQTLVQRHPHYYGGRTTRLQGTTANEERAGRSGQGPRVDSRLENAERNRRSPADTNGVVCLPKSA